MSFQNYITGLFTIFNRPQIALVKIIIKNRSTITCIAIVSLLDTELDKLYYELLTMTNSIEANVMP